MKTQVLLLVLTITFSTAQAQKFHFGLSLQPALTGDLLNNDGSIPDVVVDELKSTENQTFGYSGYLFTRYRLSSRSNLQVGLGYLQTGYVSNRVKLIFAQPEPNAPEFITFAIRHRDIFVPLLFQYNLGQRISHFYLITGLAPQIKLSRTKIIRKEYAGGVKSTSSQDDTAANYRALNINGVLGIGYELALSAKTHLFFQPTVDCNILGTAKSAALNRNLYSLGLQMGLILN